MSLQLILGGSGSGKSTYLYKEVIDGSLNDPTQMYIIIVPEQYTMATQRLLVQLHPRHGLMNIEILSFERLAMRVFDELGTDIHTMLGETGKTLMLAHLASEMSDELPTLGNKLKRPGFLNEIKSLISELSLYDISPEELIESAKEAGLNKASIEKTTQISKLYRRFLDEIEGSFITAEKVLELLIPIVEDSKIVCGSVMVFDGFTGFTPLQNELMSIFMRIASAVKVSLCVDQSEDVYSGYSEDELFYVSKRSAISLRNIAQSVGCEIMEDVRLVMDEHSRFPRQNALSHIETCLFRDGNSVYEGDASEITITKCHDPRREVWYAAACIHRLIRTKGYRYSDIAVCSYALETYSPYVEEAFRAFLIPGFIDEKSVVSFSPCFEFITAALEMEVYGYDHDSVMHFLRSGPWIIKESDKDLLDRYLSVTSLRGAKVYESVFKVSSSEFTAEEIVRLNEIREELWSKICPYHDKLTGEDLTISDITRALYELLIAYDIESKLEELCAEAEKAGDEKKAREYDRIYRITIDLFDQFIELLGDRIVTKEEYLDLFASGIENAKIGRIPAQNDSVIVGDIERTRIDDKKVLILLGANDGIIPKAVQRGGLLSQPERMKLMERGLQMAPSDREQTFMQRFYLYMALTKPSEALYITYSDIGSDGTTLRPSYLISTLQTMLPHYHRGDYMDEDMWMESDEAIKIYLSEIFRELSVTGKVDSDVAAGIIAFCEKRDPVGLNRLLSTADQIYKPSKISESVMRAIDNGMIRGSISRMESYSACAFKYFLQYVLNLHEPPDVGLEAVDMGTLYHDALYLYERSLKDGGYDFAKISEEDSGRLLKSAIDQAFSRIEKPHILSSARQSQILKRMEETLKRTVWALHKQIAAGDYVPEDFEVSLAKAAGQTDLITPIGDGCKLKLSGRIDRFDRMIKDDISYLKVVDYKSSKKDLELTRVYHGLELQLLYYMNNLMKGEKKRCPDNDVICAAAFYYALLDPTINATWDSSDEEMEKEILKALKPKGIMGDNDEAILGMDRDLAEARRSGTGERSDVISASVNRDGSFSRNTALTPEDDFKLLCDFAESKVLGTASQIAKGEFPIEPYRQKDKKGCDFCPYRSICGFDTDLRGFSYKDINEMTDDEVMEKIREE